VPTTVYSTHHRQCAENLRRLRAVASSGVSCHGGDHLRVKLPLHLLTEMADPRVDRYLHLHEQGSYMKFLTDGRRTNSLVFGYHAHFTCVYARAAHHQDIKSILTPTMIAVYIR
jgi:hypothetical protein